MLTAFALPSVYGWNVVDILSLVFIFSKNVVQKELRNLVSLYDMILISI
jgi:hypothetical protein